MYNTSQLYELSFVAPNRKRGTGPQIVCTVSKMHWEEIRDRIHVVVHNLHTEAQEYLCEDAYFVPTVPDLFAKTEFGYGNCGFVEYANGEVRLHVELRGEEALHECVMTLYMLVRTLAIPLEKSPPSNKLQQADLEMRCSLDRGHPVGGQVSARLGAWLREQGKRTSHNRTASLDDKVVQAMRSTWRAAVSPELGRWASDCRARVSPEGYFMLECFGNACDIAIYPDGVGPQDFDSEYGVRFGCHNLDSPAQQITLIAGFAKMCELAREAENNN